MLLFEFKLSRFGFRMTLRISTTALGATYPPLNHSVQVLLARQTLDCRREKTWSALESVVSDSLQTSADLPCTIAVGDFELVVLEDAS